MKRTLAYLAVALASILGTMIVLGRGSGTAFADDKKPDDLTCRSIRTEKLDLVDAEGKIRITMHCGTGEEVGIQILDSHGTSRIEIGINRDSAPAVSLLDSKGQLRTWYSLGSKDKKEDAFIRMLDEASKQVWFAPTK